MGLLDRIGSRETTEVGKHDWMPEQRVDQRIADYRAADSFETACGACDYFRPSDAAGSGWCVRVAGQIRVDYTCDLFEPVEVQTEKAVRIEKVDEERQLVFGWAYVSEDGDGQVVDHSGEFIEKGDLEDAAYVFNLVFREGDEGHTEEVKAHLVESFVATDDKLHVLARGDEQTFTTLRKALPTGWWTGWYVPDAELFGRVKSGELTMMSIGGLARKEAVHG